MKIKSHITTQQLVACEASHLHAFLDRVQAAPAVPALRPNALSDPESPDDDGPGEDFSDDYMAAVYPARPAMQVDESSGLAVIPIKGIITRGMSVFEQRYFGLADVDTIAAMIDAAAANPKINTLVYDVESPGGYISGVEELAEKNARVTSMSGKRTIAYARDICASAAYEIVAPCSQIFAAPSSCIGSIGVKCTFVDYSAMADKMGIKVQVFASGQFKAMGTPGTSLTKAQEEFIQAGIDREAGKFKALVQGMRPGVPDEAMQGQCFSGMEALKVILIDGLVPDLATLLARL